MAVFPTAPALNAVQPPVPIDTFPHLVVEFKPNSDESYLVVQREFKAGEVVAKLEGLTRNAKKAYSSVQIGPGPNDHIELNSELLYINHSCRPNVCFRISLSTPEDEWAVMAVQDLKKGDVLTFSYFSTEWKMDRPFDCRCGESVCLGNISGAHVLSRAQLKAQPYTSPHILQMKEAQEAGQLA